MACLRLWQVPTEVRWAAGPDMQALWLAAGRLLLDRHAWVRRAAGRLLGAAFADSKIGASGVRVQVWPGVKELQTTPPRCGVPVQRYGQVGPPQRSARV